jgi:hypothetical protein
MAAISTRRSTSRSPYRYPSIVRSTFGSTCLNRSTTDRTPNSGAQLVQIAPSDAVASSATTASGTFGR